ncbi:MAG: hypothetical protein ACOCRU_03025 [bacterium]
MQQTTVQNSRTLRFGSGVMEVGDDIGSLVNLGAMTGIQFQETWEDLMLESDNAGSEPIGKINQRAAIIGNLQEINFTNLHNLRGGYDNIENIAGDLVPGEEQVVAQGNWKNDKFIKFEHQNGDGSAITVNSVSGSSSNELTVDVDYFIAQNEHNEYGIIVQDGVSESQSLTLDYDYTPNAAVKFSSGGKTTIDPKVVRITNTNEFGKKFQITIFKARNQDAIDITFPADTSGEVATTPINMQGTLDKDREVGEQLFDILDEQSAG